MRRTALTVLAALVGAGGLWLWRGLDHAAFFTLCAAATALLLPPVAVLAWRFQILALPGGRDIHGHPTPRTGGAALFVPIAAVLATVGFLGDEGALGLLVGATLVFGLGLLDDAKRASPRLKIAVQLLAGLALIAGGFRLSHLDLPVLGSIELGYFEIPALLFWIVLVTNAFNLSDGLDGLAPSLAILALAALAAAGVPGLLPAALAGACLGFLNYNLPPARIFLGDSGSLLLGFLLAALALRLPAASNVPVALAVFAYSLGDVALVTFRRWIRAKPLFVPDRSHVHHKILQHLGKRPLAALVVVTLFAATHALFGVLRPGLLSLCASAAIWIVAVALLVRAGNYKPREVLNQRRSMRELHLLRSYVLGSLPHAHSRARVTSLLQYVADETQLCELTLDDIAVGSPGGCEHVAANGQDLNVACKAHVVATAPRSCTWRAEPLADDRVLDQERAAFVKEALLRSTAQLAHLERNGQRSTPAES